MQGPSTYRPLMTTATLLAAALAAGPALGQVQVQQGSSHDANQQVGSGGYNQPGQQVDYSTNNLLITGNVGGGRSFQGDVGYTAPGAFQGSLGSDSLFNFQRDSVYSVTGGAGLRAQSSGGQVIITRSSTDLAGLRVGDGLGLSTNSVYDPRSGVVTFRQNGGGLIAVTGVTDPAALDRGSTLGLIRTPDGGYASIDASPLTGITYNPLDLNPTGLAALRNRDAQLEQADLETYSILDQLNQEDRSTTTQQRLNLDTQQQPTEAGDAADEEDGTTGSNPLGMPMTLELGNQLQSQFAAQLAGREDYQGGNSQIAQIRGVVFGRQQPDAPIDPNLPQQAPQNPYEKLIEDIRQQALDSLEQAAPEEQTDDQGAERPAWQQILDSPEQAILDAKRKAREDALRISLGMVDEQGNIDYSQDLPTIDENSELGKLLADLDYKLPPIQTLAGDKKNRINGLMTRGEQELAAGRYLTAETVYRQVLRETGDNPLAQAGLIHSQLGAGMIRSSAYNLRALFSAHPELIALRYDGKLLPDNDRLRWLQGQVQDMLNDQEHGADPGLILAYLGYQLQAPPLIEYGLSVAEAAAPRDPLMPVLRRIWLDEGAKKDADANK